MQTIRLEVKEDYLQKVMGLLESLQGVMVDRFELEDKATLSGDPYYYERKAMLEKLAKEVENGEMELYNFNEEMDKLIADLEK